VVRKQKKNNSVITEQFFLFSLASRENRENSGKRCKCSKKQKFKQTITKSITGNLVLFLERLIWMNIKQKLQE